jgi:hypothetical protein
MTERKTIDVEGWQRYRAVRTLIEFLAAHPEMILNIRMQHRKGGDDECYARCGAWPCLLRCAAEEALRQSNLDVA